MTSPLSRVLVTGAGGFVGGAVCALLRQQGVTVRALLRQPRPGPWEEAVTGDLTQEPLPAGLMAGVDGVIHLAGYTHAARTLNEADAAAYQRVNVEGTQRLLEAAVQADVGRCVFMSSVKAMGEGGPERLDESATRLPATPYGQTKRMAERLLLEQSGIPHGCVLRPAMVYGAGGKGNLERMIAAMVRGRFPPLPAVENRRSMVHVEDLAQAVWLALTRPAAAGKIYLVTDGEGYATYRIADAILEELGRKLPRWRVPLEALQAAAWLGDTLERWSGRPLPLNREVLDKLLGSAWYDSGRIGRELGFVPVWNVWGALPEMIQRHRKERA